MAEQNDNLDMGAQERVGDYLRRVREAHGLELKQLSKSICLQMHILQAIEDNQWSQFKTEAYLRSYIGSICTKLSLDKNAVLKKFSAEINSQFRIAQNIAGDDESQIGASPSNTPKIAIIAVLVIAVIVFFSVRVYKSFEEDSIQTLLDKKTELKVVDSLPAIKDTTPAEKVAPVETVKEAESPSPADYEQPQKDALAKDTLRFECTLAAKEDFCGGITLKGFDIGVKYFKKSISRQINHGDTVQITITVPERTKLLFNNKELIYGNFNTLYFYKGEIVHKLNRKLM